MSDERYTRQARKEILGPDFDNQNLLVPAGTLSRIAARADQLKRSEISAQLVTPHQLLTRLLVTKGTPDPTILSAWNLLLCHLADNVYEARRASTNHRLTDIMDFKLWLEELGEQVRKMQEGA